MLKIYMYMYFILLLITSPSNTSFTFVCASSWLIRTLFLERATCLSPCLLVMTNDRPFGQQWRLCPVCLDVLSDWVNTTPSYARQQITRPFSERGSRGRLFPYTANGIISLSWVMVTGGTLLFRPVVEQKRGAVVRPALKNTRKIPGPKKTYL